MNRFKGYQIEFIPESKKELDSLEKQYSNKIKKKLQELISGFQNIDIKKMQNSESLYRVRVGNYRVIFKDEKDILRVLIVKIDHRRQIYRHI